MGLEKEARMSQHTPGQGGETMSQPHKGFWIRSIGKNGADKVPVFIYGPTTRPDEGWVGHDLRLRPQSLGPGPYTFVVNPESVEYEPTQ